MADNLNYRTATGSSCYFAVNNLDSLANCATYGRLYDWNSAMTACPKGWHLPDSTEWNILTVFAGGDNSASRLKGNTPLWRFFNSGTNDYEFAALPGGYGDSVGATFSSMGSLGVWWTATVNASLDSSMRVVIYNAFSSYQRDKSTQDLRYSVRCIQDNP
jgi:uncharacterized protein (TIGR02145 family)